MDNKSRTLKPHIIRCVPQGNKEYHCVICNKNISRSQCYYHQSCANKDERQHICTICDRKYASKSHLNYHLKSHNEDYCYCVKCGQTMINSVVLKKHVKLYCKETYINEKSIKCNKCLKTFNKLSAMQRHRAKHLEKKYECKQCNKQFKRNSTLREHVKRHLGVMCAVCNICCKLLKDASTLHRHLKLHKDNERYKCTICSTTTSRKDNMLRHLRNIHNDNDIQSSLNDELPKTKYRKYTCTQMDRFGSNNELYNRFYEHLPKPIENSTVIKYIGNVKPIMIPKESLTMLEQYQEQKEYDPIAMYRKILTMSDNADIT